MLTSVNADVINGLLQRYAPIVYFHPQEQYLMCSVEWFLSQATLKVAATGATLPTNNLPTDGDGKDKYYLTVPAAAHAGNLASAKALVNAKLVADGAFLDLQFWFFYAYNGAGTAKASPLTDSLALTPIGEHEGDWEHITMRFRADNLALVRVYMSQHDGGLWLDNPGSDLEWQSGRPVVYASLNGHASYPHAGANIAHETDLKICDFGLRNDTARGASVDFLGRCTVIHTNFLDSSIFPPPAWLSYTGRWGLIRDYTPAILSGLDPVSKAAVQGILSKLPDEVSGESGPEGPAKKGSWEASWSGDDESVCPASPSVGFMVLRRSYLASPINPDGSAVTDFLARNSHLQVIFSDGRQWSPDVTIPLGISDNPSAVMYNGQIYAFHQGYNNCGELWYTVFDGHQWGPDTKIPLGLSASPSPVVFGGKLYVFHQGYGNSGDLWYITFDGTQWSADTKMSVGITNSPSAVAYGGRLHVFHQGYGNSGELWCVSFDGQYWSGDTKLQNVGMSASPSAIVFQNKLYVFHEGAGNNGETWYSTFSGSSWGADVRAPLGTSGGVSTMVYDRKLYCIHHGYHDSHTTWIVSYDGSTWSSDVEYTNMGLNGTPLGIVWRDPAPIADGTYKLTSVLSGKAVDVNGGSTENGAKIIQWPYGGGDNQKWVFAYQGGGYYRITSLKSGKVLDVSGGSVADGGFLIQWPWASGDNQLWQVVPNGDGTFALVSKKSLKVLDNANTTADAAGVIQFTWNGGPQQKWRIEAV